MNFASAAASVLGREAMRDLDAKTIASGTASLELMERAGSAIADSLADQAFHGIALPESPRLLVLAGRGNNGGDGLVVARLLASRRWRCTVALVDGEPAGGGDAATNLAQWRRIGGPVIDAGEAARILGAGATDFDLALDAIYGTGLVRPVESPLSEFFRVVNTSGLPLVAADIASGICSDSGVPLGAALRARATLTIGAAKPGLFLDEGPDFSGRVRVADIALLAPARAGVIRVGVVLDHTTTSGSWPRLAPLSHKGSRGHVLIVAGSRGKTGAAVLAARGALRAGAGLVTVAGVAEVQAAVAMALPEAMTIAVAADGRGRIAASAAAELVDAVRGADCVVAGPGLGIGSGADAVVEMVLDEADALVLDADALNVVAAWHETRRAAVFERRAAAALPAPILTPHPGEMGRLVSQTGAHVQLSRKVYADKLAEELYSVVLLKGAATIVSDASAHPGLQHGDVPRPVTAFNLSGNPGMAAAGMGDVLAGICGALAIRLDSPFEAACLAAWVHGAAGDALASRGGPGFLAGELADAVPALLASRRPR